MLALIPPDGYVTFEMFLRVGKSTASRGLVHACAIGVLKMFLRVGKSTASRGLVHACAIGVLKSIAARADPEAKQREVLVRAKTCRKSPSMVI